jgi:hypothetical protein
MKRASYLGGLGGLALGMGIMYLWDPSAGRRRRTLVRDRALRALHQVEYGARRRAADLRHREIGAPLLDRLAALVRRLIEQPGRGESAAGARRPSRLHPLRSIDVQSPSP